MATRWSHTQVPKDDPGTDTHACALEEIQSMLAAPVGEHFDCDRLLHGSAPERTACVALERPTRRSGEYQQHPLGNAGAREDEDSILASTRASAAHLDRLVRRTSQRIHRQHLHFSREKMVTPLNLSNLCSACSARDCSQTKGGRCKMVGLAAVQTRTWDEFSTA
jgi:hypothetical protein